MLEQILPWIVSTIHVLYCIALILKFNVSPLQKGNSPRDLAVLNGQEVVVEKLDENITCSQTC